MHTKNIPVFTKKQLDVARRTNMLAFMLEKGEIFEQVSSKFVEHVDHDSMRANIKNGIVNWYSEGISSYDNAIEFCMAYYNEPYEDTVQQLLDYQFARQINKEFSKRWINKEEKIRLICNIYPLQEIMIQADLMKKGGLICVVGIYRTKRLVVLQMGQLLQTIVGIFCLKSQTLGRTNLGPMLGLMFKEHMLSR